MKKLYLISLILLLSASIFLSNCAKSTATTPAATSTTTPAATSTTTKPATTPATTTTATIKTGGVFNYSATTTASAIGYPPMIVQAGFLQSAPFLEALFTFDFDGQLQPKLAKGYKMSADNKVFTIYLREGVKFQDGTDCDAEAVKWNMGQFAIEKVARLVDVTSIDVVDKYTLNLNLKSFSNTLYYDLVMNGGLVISPTAFKTRGKDWCLLNPVGTGPFKITSFQRDTLIKCVKNENYWQKGKPYLDAMNIVFIADATTRLISFQKGEIDALANPNGKDIPGLEAAGAIAKKMMNACVFMCPDSKNPDSPFSKLQVRQALEYAIDRNGLAKTGLGLFEPANQIVYPPRYAYVSGLAPREYSPTKAKALLAEAGFPNGFKTQIIPQGGVSSDPFVALQQYLADVGIVAELNIVDANRYNDFYYNGWKNGIIGNNMATEQNSINQLYRWLHPKTEYAFSTLRPPELATILDKANNTPNYDELKSLCQSAVKLCYEQSVFIPMYYGWLVTMEQPYVRGTGINVEKEAYRVYWNPQDTWLNK